MANKIIDAEFRSALTQVSDNKFCVDCLINMSYAFDGRLLSLCMF